MIYIVYVHSGDYEDYRETNICAFESKEAAEKFKAKQENKLESLRKRYPEYKNYEEWEKQEAARKIITEKMEKIDKDFSCHYDIDDVNYEITECNFKKGPR